MIRTCSKFPRNGTCIWLFLTIPKKGAQIDRSVDNYFLFLFSNRCKIFCDDIPAECGETSYELICTSLISYQFEVHSTLTLHGLSKKHIIEIL